MKHRYYAAAASLLLLFSLPLLSTDETKDYDELPDPDAISLKPAWKGMSGTCVSWGNTDTRYSKSLPAPIVTEVRSLELDAWKGEKVSAQFVVWTAEGLGSLNFTISDLKNGKEIIPSSEAEGGFVRYVMTDSLNKDGKGTCGYRDKADFDSSLVADAIDHLACEMEVPAKSTRPVWIGVKVPPQTKEGLYSGTITVKNGKKKIAALEISIKVGKRTLPAPGEGRFHLDLWQNPYAVARYHGTEPFSKEHFELMKPIMERYAEAGGDVITATVTHKPWDGQTFDPFRSMVTWMKRADGSWHFDYTVFDMWVEFMMSLGVDKQINCYSMIPWRLSFRYFDQASDSFRYIDAKPGDKEYEEFWSTMLRSFALHLKGKGWFDITYIAMDERPMKQMLAAIEVIKNADPDFKVSFAGNYHDELAGILDYYCIPITGQFPGKITEQRKKEGKTTTYYTCCSEARPNTFTFSPPAEAEWIGWHICAKGLDGYLRWALNSWPEAPLQDSRFTAWGAGDTYLIYPGGRSSIRFERLAEGIAAYEKMAILEDEAEKSGNTAMKAEIDSIKSLFPLSVEGLSAASESITAAKNILKSID